MTIFIEGHTLVPTIFGGCTEVTRSSIITPRVTMLVTMSVTGNEEARKERMITDKQLVEVVRVVTCS